MIKPGMLFIQDIAETKKCNVFVSLAEHQFLKFTCENTEDVIIDSVIKLKLGVSTAPKVIICSDLPYEAFEKPNLELNQTTLKELRKNIKHY